MRKLALTLALTMALVDISLSTPALGAEPTFFGSESQCLTALAEGKYDLYEPRAKWHGETVEGEVKPLEASACIDAEVVGGRKWVIVPAGFKLRWNTTGKPVAMEDCGGNPVYAVAYLPPVTAKEVPLPPTAESEQKKLDGLPPTNIVGSFNTTTIVNNPDPGKGTAPPGNWYTRSWKNHPWRTGLVHGVVIGIVYGIAKSGGGGHKTVNGDGNTI